MKVRVAPEFLAGLRTAATPGQTMLITEGTATDGNMPLIVMVSG